jgi:hypothetical protein
MINPHRVSLTCKAKHTHLYALDEPGEIQCLTEFCDCTINSSHIFRGFHPYVIWTDDQFQEDSGYIKTFIAIPFTSQTTFAGLPTTYPIRSTVKNGLSKKSYALVHQLCTIDAACCKDQNNDWIERLGQLDRKDKDGIEERLKYALGISETPSDDWFRKNASPELIKKIYDYLPTSLQDKAIENLLD